MDETPTRHLNIFLIKDSLSSADEILKEVSGLEHLEISFGSSVGNLYFSRSRPNPPKWLEFFGSTFDPERRGRLFNTSTKAIFLVECRGRIFALAFGYGKSLLQNSVWEERFGLRVTLNCVDPDFIRSIDKTEMDSVPRHIQEQLSNGGKASDFGINIDRDLVRGIAGTSKVPDLGSFFVGKDALNVTAKAELDDLEELLGAYYEKNNSTDYRVNFPWIDQIAEINDRGLIARLDSALVEKVRNEDPKTWLAVPKLIDWSQIQGFKYRDSERDPVSDDIALGPFLATVRDRTGLNADVLKGRRIFCYSDRNDLAYDEWRAYDCLYSEIEEMGQRYLLTGGKWYKIDEDFVSIIERDFGHIAISTIALPSYNVSSFMGRGDDKGEFGYNSSVCRSDRTKTLMDRKNISHGGGHSSIEFCDIFTQDKKLVHIKKYAASSVLSHLFAQGVNSAELFLGDSEFRRKVNVALPATHKIQNISIRPNPSDYEVVFGIISKQRGALSLPFFSKVSLRQASRRLATLGFSMSWKKIDAV